MNLKVDLPKSVLGRRRLMSEGFFGGPKADEDILESEECTEFAGSRSPRGMFGLLLGKCEA